MTRRGRPRVAIVAASLDIIGGQGIQAQALMEALVRDGYAVSFIPINPRFPRGLRWVRRVPYLRTALNTLLYLPRLWQLRRADAAHVFSASFWSFLLGPAPALVAARVLRVRAILNYHSGEAQEHLGQWGILVHPWLTLADEIVVPSGYLAGVFGRHGYAVRVIRNIVDLSRFGYRERRPLQPRLLSTRNLEPYYRVDVVLAAFRLVRAQCPGATLVVAGAGSEEPRLRRLAGDGVRFVGTVDPAAMPALCAEADIFVNASVVDNQPVSILEAAASGLPIVSTATGDIGAMVRHGDTGTIVPALEPAPMAAAVLDLLDRPERASVLARRAYDDLERYTWAAVRDQWAAVYAGTSPSPTPHAVSPEPESWLSPRTR